MIRYKSISTPSVNHDVSNFLVEIFLLNRYGMLEEYCWRKGHPNTTEWSFLLPLFKKLLKVHKIEPEQLAWFLHFHTPKSIDKDTVGLFIYNLKRIKKLFKRIPLDKLRQLYEEKFTEVDRGFMEISDNDRYDRNPVKSEKTDLLSLLERLENNG